MPTVDPQVGADAFDPKLSVSGQTPFSVGLLQEAVQDVKAALQGSQAVRERSSSWISTTPSGAASWATTVENLRLGGHDAVGEAFADFQRALKALTHRGVLLALVSKNEESTALEAIRRHPEMVLSLDDLAGWVIDSEDKAANIARLMTNLNLGLDAAVFIDDSPNERERVKSALPEVLVPDWPRIRFSTPRACGRCAVSTGRASPRKTERVRAATCRAASGTT